MVLSAGLHDGSSPHAVTETGRVMRCDAKANAIHLIDAGRSSFPPSIRLMSVEVEMWATNSKPPRRTLPGVSSTIIHQRRVVLVALAIDDIDHGCGRFTRRLRLVLRVVPIAQVGDGEAGAVGEDLEPVLAVLEDLLRRDHVQGGLAGSIG